MKQARALALLAVLLFASIAAPCARAEDDAEYDDPEDPALLVARKSFVDESPAAIGKAATVVIELYNAGESAAKDIQVDDTAELPDGLALAPGAKAAASFKRLDAGATVSFSYDVVASAGGKAVQLPRASVSYTVSDGGKDARRSGSSSAAVLYVETGLELAVRRALTAGSYATLGLLRTPEQWRSVAVVAVLFAVVFGGSTVFGKTKEAAASSRRSKALAALEKEK